MAYSLVNSIKEQRRALDREILTENNKTFGSFTGLRNRGRMYHDMLEDLTAVCREAKQANNKKYNGSEFGLNENKMLDDEFNAYRDELIGFYRNDIKTFINTQREALAKTLSTPPSPEQLRLLQTLELEKGSLTEIELNAILPQLLDNHRAVKALEGIANRAGFRIARLPQFDFETLSDNLDWAESYLLHRCSDLGDMFGGRIKSTDAKGFTSRLFFSDSEDHEYKEKAIDMFDGKAQTKEIRANIEVMKSRQLTDVEKAMLESMFDCDPRELKDKVKEAAKSPEIKALIELSETYAPVLADNSAN